MSNLRYPGIAAMAMAAFVLSSLLFTESASAEGEPRPTEPQPTSVPGTDIAIIPKSWGKIIHRYDGNGALFFEDSAGTVRVVWINKGENPADVSINSKILLIRK